MTSNSVGPKRRWVWRRVALSKNAKFHLLRMFFDFNSGSFVEETACGTPFRTLWITKHDGDPPSELRCMNCTAAAEVLVE